MTQVILTDIEGTTSSITFVKDVLFPYAHQAMDPFIRANAQDPQVRERLDAVALESGVPADDLTGLIEVLRRWIDEDRKQGDLKAIQGRIWESGYRNGDFTAPVYDDALEMLRQWHAEGVALYVYSSGSVPAQKLLFGHTQAGDLQPLFSGWFDTDVGGKREVSSYQVITSAIDVPANEILFLSDIVAELDAAREAGLDTVLLDRPQDYPTPRTGEQCNGHRRVTAFTEI
ncbi:acireductone synthase [Luteimonas sp. FXH3W]|uniref:Enolase-phosphatase E1 n=1 Tax=Aquilutibacter rugosus TaxID=3115820 RepID=A0ABU7V0D3_9GAMM